MSWEVLVHECTKPGALDVRAVHAQLGSVWECDETACQRQWRLTDVRADGEPVWAEDR